MRHSTIRNEFYYRMIARIKRQYTCPGHYIISEVALSALWDYAGQCQRRYNRLYRFGQYWEA